MMNRREFLRAVALASTAPLWVRLGKVADAAGSVPTPDRLLLVLYLNGGNDGLNTVVPFLDGAYKKQRPTVGLAPAEVLDIGDGLALHGSLKNLKKMWDARELAIVHNVGYRNPDFSHTDSTYIWETGNWERRYHTGWLGRYLDETDSPEKGPVRAVAVGTGGLPRTLIGAGNDGVSLDRLSDFSFADVGYGDAASRRTAFLGFAAGTNDGSMRSKIVAAQSNMVEAIGAVSQVAKNVEPALTPGETVAAMFAANVGTEIGFIMIEGFDTHTTQKGQHEALLTQVDKAVGEFFAAARSLGIADRVTTMTFSDFGRRVGENGGNGTDHGSSLPFLIAGPQVRGGIAHGTRPDLTDLADGNLKASISMETLYGSVISDILQTDPTPIVGRVSSPIRLLR
jgi:uncharacterized protein (DUF1501 family)